MSKPGQLSLWRYYAIEGFAAFVCTIFQMGIFFWAKERHGFSPTQCLLLGATQGTAYMLSARFGGAKAALIGYDRMLRITLTGMALVALFLWRIEWMWIPFFLMGLYTTFTGLFWPSTEASVLHAPSALNAPRRLAIYNSVWSCGSAFGFFVCGFLVAHKIDAVMWLPGIVMTSLFSLFAIPGRPKSGSHHGAAAHDENATLDATTKRRFMHMHWLANSLAYFLITSFSALLPHLGEKLGLSASATIWLTCSYLFSRAISFAILMKWDGWHYHIGWSLAAIWATLACAAVMFLCPWPALVLAACLVFGFALGLSYSGSLYYSMNYGENKGEHGGLHEAILGSGIFFGPLAGAGGAAFCGANGASVAVITVAAVAVSAGIVTINRINRR